MYTHICLGPCYFSWIWMGRDWWLRDPVVAWPRPSCHAFFSGSTRAAAAHQRWTKKIWPAMTRTVFFLPPSDSPFASDPHLNIFMILWWFCVHDLFLDRLHWAFWKSSHCSIQFPRFRQLHHTAQHRVWIATALSLWPPGDRKGRHSAASAAPWHRKNWCQRRPPPSLIPFVQKIQGSWMRSIVWSLGPWRSLKPFPWCDICLSKKLLILHLLVSTCHFEGGNCGKPTWTVRRSKFLADWFSLRSDFGHMNPFLPNEAMVKHGGSNGKELFGIWVEVSTPGIHSMPDKEIWVALATHGESQSFGHVWGCEAISCR